MAVAGAVVREHALLGGRLDLGERGRDPAIGVVGVLVLGQGHGTLEDVEALPRVAARQVDEVVEGVRRERDAALGTEPAREAALLVLERPAHDRRDLVVGQRLEPPDPEARQQGGVHLEVGVLGRRADQRDRAVLDVRQQRVLLGLVEAVDLVDEQDRTPGFEREPVLRLGDGGPDLGHPGHDRGHRAELGADGVREQAGERRLAGARRAPQEQAREVTARDRAAEGAALADEVGLADELVERARAHARGERLPLGRWSEQGFGTRARWCAPGGHGPMVARADQRTLNTPVTSIAMYSTNSTIRSRIAMRRMSLRSRAT